MIIRRTLIAVLALWTLAAVLIAGMRALGQTEPLPVTFLDTGPDCEQPCWQGIQPGISTRDAFLQASREIGPYGGIATDYGDGIAASFELSTHGAITLADLIEAFGTPARVGCIHLARTTLVPGPGLVTSTRLYFADGWIVAEALGNGLTYALSPGMRIRHVTYYAPGEPIHPLGETSPWRGFATAPVYPRCS